MISVILHNKNWKKNTSYQQAIQPSLAGSECFQTEPGWQMMEVECLDLKQDKQSETK